MKDPARAQTDEWLKELERRIRREYKQAQKEITAKWNAYMKDGEEKLSALYDAYKNAPDGEKRKAKEAYQRALKDYTLQNQRFKEMERDTAYRIANVNQIAIDYVNGRLPDIYAVNYNYESPEMVKLGIDFTLVDEDTIRRMIESGEVELPKRKLNIPKDMQWNRKKMNNAILQGILQGESIPDIAKRLLPIIDQNRNAAIRNARTLVTGAENGGRNDRYKRLEDDGVIMYKMWIATGDGRTRDWHLTMDGQEVPADDVFVDGLGNELEYPGDPGGEPETVYNCRCSMRGVPKGIRGSSGKITWFNVPQHNDLHQKEIRDERQERGM